MFLIVKDDGRARVGVGRGVVNHQLLAAGGRFYSSKAYQMRNYRGF